MEITVRVTELIMAGIIVAQLIGLIVLLLNNHKNGKVQTKIPKKKVSREQIENARESLLKRKALRSGKAPEIKTVKKLPTKQRRNQTLSQHIDGE